MFASYNFACGHLHNCLGALTSVTASKKPMNTCMLDEFAVKYFALSEKMSFNFKYDIIFKQ